MKQTNTFRQTTTLAPQQVLMAKLLQATSDELEQLVIAETEKNLALELEDGTAHQEEGDDIASSDMEGDAGNGMDEDSYEDNPSDSPFYTDEDDQPRETASSDDESYSPILNCQSDFSFRDDLLRQLEEIDLSEDELFLSRYLVNSLDDNGYLTRPLNELADDLAFTQMYDTNVDVLERILVDIVQSLDPAGIGARDLKECLALQLLEMKSSSSIQTAYQIISKCFDDLTGHRYEKICQHLSITEEELKAAQRVISRLNPKPGGQSRETEVSEIRASHVKPEFSIHNEDGELTVMLNDMRLPAVRVSPDYQVMLERIQEDSSLSADRRQGIAMLRDSIAQARGFMDMLRQRRETLSAVIRVIAHMQRDYFLSGGNPEHLRPMVMQDVADRTGYDVATISRVSNSKYIDTDFGIIPVRDLFSSGIQTQQGEVSNVAVQELLRELISQEDKKEPLSDDALAALLSERGYPIARRTVAKYREQLNIPTARLRRTI